MRIRVLPELIGFPKYLGDSLKVFLRLFLHYGRKPRFIVFQVTDSLATPSRTVSALRLSRYVTIAIDHNLPPAGRSVHTTFFKPALAADESVTARDSGRTVSLQ